MKYCCCWCKTIQLALGMFALGDVCSGPAHDAVYHGANRGSTQTRCGCGQTRRVDIAGGRHGIDWAMPGINETALVQYAGIGIARAFALNLAPPALLLFCPNLIVKVTLRRSDFLLVRHPNSPVDSVYSISVEISIPAPAGLRVVFRFAGDTQTLRIPGRMAAGRQDQLWRHTCFEMFLRNGDGSYYEFNFSPSTKWAVYCFDSYRRGMKEQNLASSPLINSELTSDSFILDATIDLQGMLDDYLQPRPGIGLAAVIEDANGRISYWALAHPQGIPDFHHADGFVGVLPDNGT